MNTQIQTTSPLNPAMPAQLNAGAVTIEAQRAITEAQSKIQIAKMFPRNEAVAYEQLMFACAQPAFAEEAFYSVPRGKEKITGPSIRLAEEIARVYGNFTYGHRELSRSNGKSEVEVFAWDVENNNYTSRQITVMHIRDTRSGGYSLNTQSDIDERIANVAAKQQRSRILALIPKWMLAAAIEKCKETLAGGVNQQERTARIENLVKRFAQRGVVQEKLDKYLGHPVNMMTNDEITSLYGIYVAIKEGASPAEFFIEPQTVQQETAMRLEQAIRGNNGEGETTQAQEAKADAGE